MGTVYQSLYLSLRLFRIHAIGCLRTKIVALLVSPVIQWLLLFLLFQELIKRHQFQSGHSKLLQIRKLLTDSKEFSLSLPFRAFVHSKSTHMSLVHNHVFLFDCRSTFFCHRKSGSVRNESITGRPHYFPSIFLVAGDIPCIRVQK